MHPAAIGAALGGRPSTRMAQIDGGGRNTRRLSFVSDSMRSLRHGATVMLAGALAMAGCTPSRPPAAPRSAARAAAPPSSSALPTPAFGSRPLLVWSRSGLPSGFAGTIGHLPGVTRLVTVVTGTAWLTDSFDRDGHSVARPPAGLSIPLEVAGANPTAFGAFMPTADDAYVPALSAGQGILGTTSARLRRLGAGGVLALGPARITIAGVVPDADIGAYELFVSRTTAARLGIRTPTYAMVQPVPGASVSGLARSIRRLMPAGLPLVIRLPGRARYLRQADAVLPAVMEKAPFGEFAARVIPGTGGHLAVDRAWVQRHIITTRVPVLGEVTCNRAILPQLDGALGQIASEGLAGLVHPGDYGGCYVPRLIPDAPGAPISHHSWGVAIDINVSENPLGQLPHQDPRVVAIFERWAFTWGGRWIVPDGMHFEYLHPPEP